MFTKNNEWNNVSLCSDIYTPAISKLGQLIVTTKLCSLVVATHGIG